MPAVPIWVSDVDDPTEFVLTNPYSTYLSINTQQSDRLYLLDEKGCDFKIGVRSTKDNVPQSDGSILHHRFLTGVEMELAIQCWERPEFPASGALLVEMLDDVSGAFRSLLNAGDNAGRLSWEIDGGPTRMLDDIRLLVYPAMRTADGLAVVKVTIDTEYPYAQNLTEVRTECSDGVPEAVVNTGSADYFPVFLVNKLGNVPSGGSVSDFTITNTSTGQQFVYSDSLPGAIPIPAGGHWAEINTFRNTIYLDGDSSDLKAGVDELNSEYFVLQVGTNNIVIDGCDMDILWAPAWG